MQLERHDLNTNPVFRHVVPHAPVTELSDLRPECFCNLILIYLEFKKREKHKVEAKPACFMILASFNHHVFCVDPPLLRLT